MPKFPRKRKHLTKTTECEPKQMKVDAPEPESSGILFGGTSGLLKSLEEAVDSGLGEQDDEEGTGDELDERKPAWYDEDDDGIEIGQALQAQRRKLPGAQLHTNKYSNYLKHKFNAVVGVPKWAQLNNAAKDDSDEDDEEVFKNTSGLGSKNASHGSLPPSILEFKKVSDVNSKSYSEGPYVNSVVFHPSSSVALVAGNNGIASLYSIDGKQNSKLHSLAFDNYPIFNATFILNGNEAVLGSRYSHIFAYDLMAAKPIRYNLPCGLTQCKKFIASPDGQYIAVAGKWGQIHLLSSHSKEDVATLKQDGDVTALSFNSDGTILFGHSNNGEVTLWDMNTRRIRHKFIDEGCLQGSTIAVSSSNQFVATGSAQGVVNLYKMENVLNQKIAKPFKSIFNLTTSITSLKFNPSSEILAFSSSDIQNSIKLFHVGSETVFSNFPTFNSKLGHVNCLDFSPNSGYLTFGNRKSIVALYRLKHYNNY